MSRITPEERSEAFRTAIALARQNIRTLEVVCRFLEGEATDKVEVQPTEEEQRILDLFDDGVVLTGAKIADFLGDETDNGTLRNRLSAMVKKGFLVNKRPGYSLPE